MSLKLYFHPLSSFCWKALIAFYENETPFEPHVVNLGDETERSEFLKLWPIGKFPVLRDEANGLTIPESSIIIEYLASYYPGRAQLVPDDVNLAREVRLRDRVFDLYIHDPMQRIVADRLRPADRKDPFGVDQTRAKLRTGLDLVDKEMSSKTWAAGDHFSMADCAAAPALFYANRVLPFSETHRNATRYFDQLMARPSFARVVEEAKPYFALFPS
ncbi:glutathione S-transferase family protein [Bradyrhizobium sp. SYSU BS000235]|uniref:glutathione S-transferase family protein n=1 Tax=Bradyrhizobium sp. SYSU BS000235 TaxID=3411332 RepID=UPI003C760A96